MPVFEIQGPDGRTYEIDAPDQAAALSAFQGFVRQQTNPVERPRSQQLMDEYERAEAAGDHARADELLREATYAATQDGTAPDSVAYNPATGGMEDMALRGDRGRLSAAAQGLGQGVSFGGMDEVVGLGHGLMGPGTYEQNRDYALASMRGDLAAGRRDYPVTAIGSEVLGSAASSMAGVNALAAKGVLAPTANIHAMARQGAALGAAEGGLYGGLTGEGGVDRLKGSLRGAMIGTATGAAAPYAIEGVRRGFDYVAGGPAAAMRSAPSEVRASRAVQKAVDRSGRTPQEIDEAIQTARAVGQDYTIADATGYSGQRMLAGAARTPGDGRQGIIDHLSGRQDGQGRRIAGALDEALNAPSNAGKTAGAVRAGLTEARDAAADSAYAAARRNAGPVDVRGALSVIDDRIGPMQGSGVAGDGIDGVLDGFRRRLESVGGDAFPDATSVQLSDFSRVLGVKQDVDDAIGAAVKAGKGNLARELQGLKSSLDEALSLASEPYAAARDSFARGSRTIEQIDAGIAATSPRARVSDNLGHYNALNPEGQAAYRAGYADPLMARIENAAPGVNKARPLLSDGSVSELRAMAHNPDDLIAFLNREGDMFRSANAAMGGSMTADNLADAADITQLGSGAIVNLLTGNFGQAIRQGADTVVNALSGRNTSTREQIARLLLSGDVNSAMAPALQRAQENALRSTYGQAGIRAIERVLNR